MAPLLYTLDISPPCRAIYMVAKAIGLTLDHKLTNLFKREHLTPEFLKMNPEGLIPTLDDDGFILWDSHAINIYLINKYAKDDSLYPNDIKKRAIINQRLHFDSGVAFALVIQIAKPLRLYQRDTVPDNLKAELRELYRVVESYLQGNKWVCGDTVTVADMQLVATVSSIKMYDPLTDEYPNVIRWLVNCEKESWYEPNKKGLQDYYSTFSSFLK